MENKYKCRVCEAETFDLNGWFGTLNTDNYYCPSCHERIVKMYMEVAQARPDLASEVRLLTKQIELEGKATRSAIQDLTNTMLELSLAIRSEQ